MLHSSSAHKQSSVSTASGFPTLCSLLKASVSEVQKEQEIGPRASPEFVLISPGSHTQTLCTSVCVYFYAIFLSRVHATECEQTISETHNDFNAF